MAIAGINTANSTVHKNSTVQQSTSNSSLSINDFYNLLAAQMKYQDMDNPMDTSEMMASMVQTQMIEALTQMTTMNTTTYVASMVGKEITVAETDSEGRYIGDKKGVATGVVLGDNPVIFVDGKGYAMNQIMSIGEIPDKTDAEAEASTDDSQK